MADTPARKGFSLSNPGAKEYLIVGGVVLVAAAAYFWWKNRQAANAATSTPTSAGTSAPDTATGLNTANWLAWVQDHNTSTTTTTTTPGSTPAGTTTAPKVVTLGAATKLGALATRYKIPLWQLRDLNPGLNQEYGNFKRIPKGTKVVVSG